jgi:peptidoglycan/LPS O-acetylase OafA/YrhL
MCCAFPQPFDAKLVATLAQNLVFLNQITTDVSFVGPAWSLALEFWLYCLTPWLWRLKADQLRVVMYASFAAYCCYELCRTAFHLPYYAGAGYGINLPLLSFVWLAGFLIAREPSVAGRTIRDCGLILLGHVLLAAAIKGLSRWKHEELSAYFSVDLFEFLARGATLAAVLILFKWIVEGRTGATRSGVMRLLGDISYPLYLVHIAVFTLVLGFGIRNATLQIGAALLIAFLFYRCIDFYSRNRERPERPVPDTAATRHQPQIDPTAVPGLQNQEIGELPPRGSHLRA